MKVTEAVQQRRSVKWFDPEHRMPEATFQRLMQHALLSPTAFNIQNWRFVRVNDAEQRQAIRAVAWDQAQVTDASELLVLCFDQLLPQAGGFFLCGLEHRLVAGQLLQLIFQLLAHLLLIFQRLAEHPHLLRCAKLVDHSVPSESLAFVPQQTRHRFHAHFQQNVVSQATVEDLQRKQRLCPPGRLLLFAVDVSGSMGG